MKKVIFFMLFVNILFANVVTIISGEVTSSHIEQGEVTDYKILASAGSVVTVLLDGLSDDADMSVRIGHKVQGNIYDCKSQNSGTKSESCSVTLPKRAELYIRVHGYKPTNYNLKAVETVSNITELTSNIAVSGSVQQNETKFYKIAGVTGSTLDSLISNLSADADLYVRVGEKPTGSLYDCKSSNSRKNDDSCSITVDKNQDVYIAVYGYKAASYDVKATLTQQQNSASKIFIIGDSTVYNETLGNVGWGSKLNLYMKNPNNVYNRAREGASSKSFLIDSASHHDWSTMKNIMQNANLLNPAYLFIQFGHNDEKEGYRHTETGRDNSYYTYLKTYIDTARNLGITPVLITPVNRLYKNKRTHGEYPQTMKDLAEDENVLLLDLEYKSFVEYNKYPNDQVLQNFFAYSGRTHFNAEGAKVVAGWVKELICNSNEDTLCSQFK